MREPWLHQETDPPGGSGEGADTGAGRPDWLEERYQSVEDQAKAYGESRKEMDRLRSQMEEERAQWSAALEQISQQQQAPAPQQPGLDPQTNQLLAAYQQAIDSGDAAAQLAIQVALNQQATASLIEERFKEFTPKIEQQQQADRDIAFQIAQDRVARQYGDKWAELSPEVNKWLHEHASWLPTVNSPEAFEQVIREGAMSIEGAKAAQQLAELEAARNARLSAQTATGGSTTQHPTATDDKKKAWEEVKNAPVVSYSDLVSRG